MSISNPKAEDRRIDDELLPSPPPRGSGGAGFVPAYVTFDEDPENGPKNGPQDIKETASNDTECASSEAYAGPLTPGTGASSLRLLQSPALVEPLPAFITPLSSSRISAIDLDFLRLKGALTIPEPDLQLEIIRGYLFSVHPFMPMLDYRTFIRAVTQNREDCRISLLLFQAVMFAGLHSLQLPTIRRLGFESAKQAREVFFDRAKYLYDFDVEPDDAAVLQSLLLMSSWYSKYGDRRHTWQWTGLAYDVARTLGLHREQATRIIPDKVRRFRRRLWWSLYIRDRLIALGTRRPMRIRDDEFDVTMLSIDDFDLEPSEDEEGDIRIQHLAPSSQENMSTALMCVELTKLCVCIGHVVSSQYTTLTAQPEIPHTVMIVSKRCQGGTEDLRSCERELNDWFDALATGVRTSNPPVVSDDMHSCCEVHWAILNMTYQTTVNVLHRAHALQPLSEAPEAQHIQTSSRSKVKDAARNITRLAQSMLRNDQVRFLGVSGVTALIAAYLSHMLDVSSADEDVRDASTFRLCQTLQVLQSLNGIYASADAAESFLASVTRKAGISVPPPTATTGDPGVALVAPPARTMSTGNLRTAWDPSAGYPGRNTRLSTEQQSDLSQPGWQSNTYQIPNQPAFSCRQPQVIQQERRESNVTAGGLISPFPRPTSNFMTPVQASVARDGTTADPATTNPNTSIYNVPTMDGAFFEWSGTIGGAGVDMEMMPFNTDVFHSDAFAFGFMEAQPPR
jgi:hypothetical protein